MRSGRPQPARVARLQAVLEQRLAEQVPLDQADAEVLQAAAFVDRCTEMVLRDALDTPTASMAKYWCTDLQGKVMDACVQLFGGYGYLWDYPIARAYADARVQRIHGGTNEIMKEAIARSMGLGR